MSDAMNKTLNIKNKYNKQYTEWYNSRHKKYFIVYVIETRILFLFFIN